ncbi:30S ribosomal protein S19 [Colletotrichum scovillei]|uniref:30S ribosomal protein S19 n=1 Tax=Colletotrichum scovillei TaxID=1209932 RepID=A0A9P7U507_9PEZI|nr:30S ribosomal protein S19 [Colletotrichum scovillei]KAG7042146.1 30S ribosomal protein S19 [Colletotrichum scovillei]KAG7062180.1 30S ribosomal protein S19 [Colletotrichum scovillei]
MRNYAKQVNGETRDTLQHWFQILVPHHPLHIGETELQKQFSEIIISGYGVRVNVPNRIGRASQHLVGAWGMQQILAKLVQAKSFEFNNLELICYEIKLRVCEEDFLVAWMISQAAGHFVEYG